MRGNRESVGTDQDRAPVPTAPDDAEWEDDDPRWDVEELTRGFGPDRIDVTTIGEPRRSGRSRVLVRVVPAALLLAAVLAGTALTTGHGSRGEPPVRPRAPDTSTTSTTPDPVLDGGILHTPDGRSFRIGQPGDVLLLGDWDCDGSRTAALYRPSTGEVFIFDTWPSDGPLSSGWPEPSGVRHGLATVSDRSGCDRVVVSPDPPGPP